MSIQVLAALIIHFGGDKTTSKNALSESLDNLLFQALSKGNGNIYLNFDNVGELIIDILEGLLEKDQQSIVVAKKRGEN